MTPAPFEHARDNAGDQLQGCAQVNIDYRINGSGFSFMQRTGSSSETCAVYQDIGRNCFGQFLDSINLGKVNAMRNAVGLLLKLL